MCGEGLEFVEGYGGVVGGIDEGGDLGGGSLGDTGGGAEEVGPDGDVGWY